MLNKKKESRGDASANVSTLSEKKVLRGEKGREKGGTSAFRGPRFSFFEELIEEKRTKEKKKEERPALVTSCVRGSRKKNFKKKKGKNQ